MIPRYLFWFVPEDEGHTLEQFGLADADATYYRGDRPPESVDDLIRWSDLLIERRRMTVFLRNEVLRSDEHCRYVFAHDVFEIGKLKRVFEQNGGVLTYRRLCHLIDPRFGGAIHFDAVSHADALVSEPRKG